MKVLLFVGLLVGMATGASTALAQNPLVSSQSNGAPVFVNVVVNLPAGATPAQVAQSERFADERAFTRQVMLERSMHQMGHHYALQLMAANGGGNINFAPYMPQTMRGVDGSGGSATGGAGGKGGRNSLF